MVAVAADVTPAEEPLSVGFAGETGFDFRLRDPVVGLCEAVRVGVGGGVESREGADVELGLGRALVGREAMVKVVDHLGFDQREEPAERAVPGVSGQRLAVGFHLGTRTEEAGVVGHVEHRHVAQAPRVAVELGFVPENAGAAVDVFVEFGVGD